MYTQILLSQLKKANELEEKLEESNKKILVSTHYIILIQKETSSYYTVSSVIRIRGRTFE